MGYVLLTSSIFYLLQAITMGVVLTILFVKKGNWVAKVLTFAYMLAYCITGLLFSDWVDSGYKLTNVSSNVRNSRKLTIF